MSTRSSTGRTTPKGTTDRAHAPGKTKRGPAPTVGRPNDAAVRNPQFQPFAFLLQETGVGWERPILGGTVVVPAG